MKIIKKYSRVIIIAMLLLVVITLIFIFGYKIISKIDFSAARDYIDSYGNFSAIVYIIVFVLRTFLVIFPSSIMVVLGGSLFGHLLAFAYSMIAIFFSSSLAFFIGRYAGKDVVRKLLKGRIDKLELKIEKHGFKIILFMRLSVIFPFDIVNYAAGLSKVRYSDFILGTMLGIIPEVFSLTYFGSSLNNIFSYKFLISLGLVFITIIIPFIYKKVKNSKSP